MLTFSQRKGLTPVKKALQENRADKDLRTAVWNILHVFLFEKNAAHYTEDSHLFSFLQSSRMFFFNARIDEMEYYYNQEIDLIRKFLFDTKWNRFYDFLEFTVNQDLPYIGINLSQAFNKVFEKENSAYRFVDNILTDITNEHEQEEIQNAIENAPYHEIKEHLHQALKIMNNKENPDFRNSIKESISAVEALARKISGEDKATLGKALKKIKESRDLHGAYEDALKKLYGWTSDGDGIRHAIMDKSNLTKADARFMLITCSAFVNYLIDLSKD